REFSIVASGARIEKESDIDKLIAALEGMREETGLERCASLGMLRKETLKRLRDAGLQSYHHNLETSRGFFPAVCTTHDYEDDVNTVKTAKALGFYVCSGGIFGLGESWEHRVELAFTLKELDVDSIPINFLNPRTGTPLGSADNLTPLICIRIIMLFRFILPAKDIVICGGRPTNLRHLQPLIFAAGANGVMIGDYLTTSGRDVEDDLKMILDLGLIPRQ
ncbi:MAG: biotin synthase BioB, partial [Deltaproteobacteria bacterium]|nr:biotin synthase BioB [Deltaproteobacteria bacterium]